MSSLIDNTKEVARLRRNAIGLPGALAMSLAFISPTTGILFISALIASQAGASAPFAFIIGTLGVLLMAYILAEFTFKVPGAGTFYTFNAQGIGPKSGFLTGWLLLIAYGLQGPLNAALFGSFVANIVHTVFNISIPWWPVSIAIIILVSWLAYRSVSRSMTLDLIFVILEVVVVGILVVYIIVHGGASGQDWAAFTPSQSLKGFGGIGLSFVYILFAFFGFESSITISEETTNPRKNVPIALIGSVILTGIYFAIAMYALVIGYGVHHVGELASSTAPMSFLAQKFMGKGYAIAVDLAGISALIAVLIAAHTANFRVLYVMGREKVLPAAFGRLSRYKTPYIAVMVYGALSIIVTLAAGFAWGPFGAFGNLGFWASLGVMPIYLMVCIALWRYTRANGTFSWFKYGLIPFVTLIFYVFPIVTSLYPYPGMPLAAMPFLTIVWAIIGFMVIFTLGRRNPAALDIIGKTVFEEEDPQDASPVGTSSLSH